MRQKFFESKTYINVLLMAFFGQFDNAKLGACEQAFLSSYVDVNINIAYIVVNRK